MQTRFSPAIPFGRHVGSPAAAFVASAQTLPLDRTYKTPDFQRRWDGGASQSFNDFCTLAMHDAPINFNLQAHIKRDRTGQVTDYTVLSPQAQHPVFIDFHIRPKLWGNTQVTLQTTVIPNAKSPQASDRELSHLLDLLG